MYIKLNNYLEKQVLYCVFIGNYSYFFLLSGVKNSYFFLLLAENSYFFLLFLPLLPLDALEFSPSTMHCIFNVFYYTLYSLKKKFQTINKTVTGVKVKVKFFS